MIVDHVNKVALACVPKCGTFTVERMAKKAGHDVTGLGRHGVVAPPEAVGYRRLMTARNPWSRLVSVWSFVGSRPSEFLEGPAVVEMTFPEYVRWWERRRADFMPWQMPDWIALRMKYMWYTTAGDFLMRWKPEALVRVEHIEHDLRSAGVDWGKVYHTNTSAKHRTGNWWDHYTDEAWDAVGRLFGEQEAAWFGYPTEPPGTLGAAADSLLV